MGKRKGREGRAVKKSEKQEKACLLYTSMDGYSHIASENYAQEDMRMTAKIQTLDAMNQGMCQVLRELSQQADIRFLTAPKYVTLG